jgi:Uma2 family endonuclease
MTAVFSPPEQRVQLHNVSWEMYESLLAAHQDTSAPRFTYDRGRLEITSSSAVHEQIKEVLTLLVNVTAEEAAVDIQAYGSTTFRRQDLERGFEPDSCFYIKNAGNVRGKAQLDLTVDPPPELVIEIDITHSSIDKLSLLAHLGVDEFWRFDGTRLRIFRLMNGEYAEQDVSTAFPNLTGSLISHFIAQSRKLDRPTWLQQLRSELRQSR